MDVELGDRVKQKSGGVLGLVVAISDWLVEETSPPGKMTQLGVRPDGTDRIFWIDKQDARITKKAG